MAEMAAHNAHHGEHDAFQHQFEDMEQQRDAGTFGMWVFLAQEIMFFGGIFGAYIVYRVLFHDAFEIGSNLLNVKFGAINTIVLIASSLTMAMAIHSAQAGKKGKTQVMYLLLTVLLGVIFLTLKFSFEWTADYHEHLIPGFGFVIRNAWGGAGIHVPLFFCFYFFMTGLHALHMIIGIPIILVIAVMAWRNRFDEVYYAPLEMVGLYWHFVDIVWIFLFPLLYLVGGRYLSNGGQ
jgi:cytochrome c oxidase subunit 3